MKELTRNLVYFAVFSFAISSFTACGVDQSNSGSSADNTSASPGNSEYPKLAASLATAPFETEDGSTFTVEDRKGKVLLLNLWGIWCRPCLKEMPHLAKLQEKFRDNGLEVIGLNVGDADLEPEDFGKMKAFAEKLSLNYQLVRITNKTSNDFAQVTQFGGVPLTVLVDRDGRMRGVFKGASDAEIAKMNEMVAKVVTE